MVRRRRDQRDARHRVPQPRDQVGHLVRRELAALAGLGALDDLDLQLLGPGQVLGGDAEPGRGHLLDPVVGPVAVGAARDSCAGSSPPSPELERAPMRFIAIDERGVRLRRQRPERHRRGDEAAADRLDRLDLLERNRRARRAPPAGREGRRAGGCRSSPGIRRRRRVSRNHARAARHLRPGVPLPVQGNRPLQPQPRRDLQGRHHPADARARRHPEVALRQGRQAGVRRARPRSALPRPAVPEGADRPVPVARRLRQRQQPLAEPGSGRRSELGLRRHRGRAGGHQLGAGHAHRPPRRQLRAR